MTDIHFDYDDYTIKPQDGEILRTNARWLTDHGGSRVQVEGHTDDVPIKTPKFGSNWELSTSRASAVVAFLIENADVEPWRLSAAGYGQFHPRVPNTPTGRAQDRRVDLVVLDATTQAAEEAAPAK